MKNKTKNGISLIVLVITIIVVIILAGAIILSLSNNNPILQATKAVFVGDVGNFASELNLYEGNQYLDKLGEYDPTLLQADGASVTYDEVVDTSKTINDLIPTLGNKVKYAGQFQVIDGKLIFQGSDTNKQEWATEIGNEVIIVGEPKITIFSPSETLIIPGTDIKYSVKFSSNAPLTTIDLTDKVEILDDAGIALPIQPVINVSAISGTSSDVIRYAEITVNTDILVSGEYKLKIKSGSVINAEGNLNSQDTISLIGFEVLDNIPPENPSMSPDPTGWTNTDVAVTITYSEDSQVKEYSLDGTNWNSYTEAVVITENNTTIYARAKDASGNESGQSTLTVANIDKISPAVTATNGGATTSSITINATALDTGGSGLAVASYQYSKDNGVTWTTAASTTTYTFSGITTGTYQCKVKVADNAGNSTTSSAVAIATTGLGTITMSPSTVAWTNGNVSVTVTYPAEIVTKQYSTDGTTWNTYTVPVVVSTNGTTVYAKGLDAGGNQTTQATLTVSNIDKTAPLAPEMSSTPINGTSSGSQNVNFSESTSQSQSQVIAIPNLNSVTSSSVNTGSVNTSVSGNNVTVNCSLGSPTRNVWDSYKYSSYVSNYLTGSSSSFASTNSYGPDGSGYSGTLSENGSSYVISGTYTAGDSYTQASSSSSYSNSFASSVYYNSGGYSGTLYKSGGVTSNTVQTGGTYIPNDSQYIAYYYAFNTVWSNGTSSSVAPSSLTLTNFALSSAGYSGYEGVYNGTVNFIEYTSQAAVSNAILTNYTGNLMVTGLYNGWMYRTAVDTRTYTTTYTQIYSGTVYKSAVDTRTWRQDYIGWAYQGGYTNYYAYTAILNYLVGSTTTASVTITYPGDATIKQYSLDGSTWNTYTVPVTVNLNATVYSRCYDVAGNMSSIASKVAN